MIGSAVLSAGAQTVALYADNNSDLTTLETDLGYAGITFFCNSKCSTLQMVLVTLEAEEDSKLLF